MIALKSGLKDMRRRLAALGDLARRRAPLLKRIPPLRDLLELAARVGYGARGFVFLSIGLVALLAAVDVTGDALGSSGVAAMIGQQPFARVWLILLGLGLWAFVLWRVLQSVFDADGEGTSARAWLLRAGQAASGVFYGLLAAGVFELLDEYASDPAAEDVAENQEKAALILSLPFGDHLLLTVGLVIMAVGVGNIAKGVGADFGEALACSERLCRRLSLIARAGYVARGLAYLPLAVFVILAGWRARASEVESFGSSLDALEVQPGGSWMLALTGVGLMAFGVFAFVEARFRRIRPPRDLNPLH